MFERPWWQILLGIGSAVALGGIAIKKISNKNTLPFPPANSTKLTSYLSDGFFRGVLAMADNFNHKGSKIDGIDLLKIFLAESDCNPSIANSIGCAGLNQICNLPSVGFTQGIKAYTALPADQQLIYVQRYFDNVNHYPLINNISSLYLTNFSPAFVGKPDDFVMYRATDPVSPSTGKNTYDLNRGVDGDNKGFINVSDMAKFVERQVSFRQAKFAELKSRLDAQRSNV